LSQPYASADRRSSGDPDPRPQWRGFLLWLVKDYHSLDDDDRAECDRLHGPRRVKQCDGKVANNATAAEVESAVDLERESARRTLYSDTLCNS
jgi:hypothetical protein